MQSLKSLWNFFSTFYDFPKNSPYDSKEFFYIHSTPYQNPICAMASKPYGWDARNIAKTSLKMAKKLPFFIFSIFSKTFHTIRTKFSSHYTPYYGLCVQFYQNRMNGIRVSQKEKDLNRLLYRICGYGFNVLFTCFFRGCQQLCL